MTDPTPEAARPSSPYKAPLLLAGGGTAAGFCAASCCGLPVLLGSAVWAADGWSRSPGSPRRIGSPCWLRRQSCLPAASVQSCGGDGLPGDGLPTAQSLPHPLGGQLARF